MSNPPLSFRPNDDEYIFLDEANILNNWADFCRESIKQKREHYDMERKLMRIASYRSMCNDLLIILIGILCLSVSYVVFNLVVYVILNIGALFAIIIGFGLLIKEIQYARRLFNSTT